jgi:hypothetical protein
MYDLLGQLTAIRSISVIAKVRARLSIIKQETQKFDVETFSLKKLSYLEIRKKYQIEI